MSPPAVTGSPVIVCDLDGVIWLGDEALAGSAAAVAALRDLGMRVGFATNNSSLTVAQYLAKLAGFGIDAVAGDLATSAMAAAALLAQHLEPGARVYPCAGAGVAEALAAAGFAIVEEGQCAAVVVGWHQTFDFPRLARAAAAIREGARFVATNTDPTYPAPGGLLPGNGALVAAVATAAERTPEVVGKPFAPMVALVRTRFGSRGVMVGDRPSTDGALAAALGWPFVLVSSQATVTEVLEPPPDLVTASLHDAVPAIAALADAIAGNAPGPG